MIRELPPRQAQDIDFHVFTAIEQTGFHDPIIHAEVAKIIAKAEEAKKQSLRNRIASLLFRKNGLVEPQMLEKK